MQISKETRALAQNLIDFIDESPSPWHVVSSCEQRLIAEGYERLNESDRWQLSAGGRYFVVRGASSIIAFIAGQKPVPEAGFRIVGAHTDSPGLRLKPRAAHTSEGVMRLGVEIYGGPILATYADRDLSLAGRISVKIAGTFETRLVRFDAPLVRLPNLAIHMNREVNEQGLKFNKQTELPLLLGMSSEGIESERQLTELFSRNLDADPTDILAWEMNVFDTQKGSFWGASQEFVADSQLDNLASCHAALNALLSTDCPDATAMCAFFDHEEVGSASAAGAGGSFLADVILRIAESLGLNQEERLCALAQSFFISVDMAHAYHPNFPASYEPCHKVIVNAGPVIKTNSSQRYTTNADTAARFMGLCERADVPYQQYTHRTDLGCGSTIGPVVASNLGIASVDVGSPMWAMHSIRESAGVHDHEYMFKVLKEAFIS